MANELLRADIEVRNCSVYVDGERKFRVIDEVRFYNSDGVVARFNPYPLTFGIDGQEKVVRRKVLKFTRGDIFAYGCDGDMALYIPTDMVGFKVGKETVRPVTYGIYYGYKYRRQSYSFTVAWVRLKDGQYTYHNGNVLSASDSTITFEEIVAKELTEKAEEALRVQGEVKEKCGFSLDLVDLARLLTYYDVTERKTPRE